MHENYTIRMKGIYYFVEGNLMSEKHFKTFFSLFHLIINKKLYDAFTQEQFEQPLYFFAVQLTA